MAEKRARRSFTQAVKRLHSEAENHSPAPPAVEGHTIRWLNA